MRRVLIRAAQKLQHGVEPREASDGAVYRVRSLSHVLKRDVDWQEGSGSYLLATAGER
jgi:hypothetical protein